MSTEGKRLARLPPRWFVHLFWAAHRAVYNLTGGRVGLWRPKPGRYGTMRLTTTGRRTGTERSVILGYFEDGPNLVTMAMNGWAGPEPAWWLNLQANPAATVDLVGGRRRVVGRDARGEERSRLWAMWQQIDSNLDILCRHATRGDRGGGPGTRDRAGAVSNRRRPRRAIAP
jgi:deazaflavin-dependent oxidoreductase (nitroreductase family)